MIDPWFVNSGRVQIPDVAQAVVGSRKVFTDQIPNDPLKPYYHVKKASEINGTPVQFLSWSGNTIPAETVENNLNNDFPLVFTGANPSTIANYKGKLKTNQPNSSDSKNQRRFLVDSDGLHCVMVYESMNEIWMTLSSDGGTTWKNEVRISNGNANAKNPSLSNILTVSGNSEKFYMVTWIENNEQVLLQSEGLEVLKFGWEQNNNSNSNPFVSGVRSDQTNFTGIIPSQNAYPVLSLSFLPGEVLQIRLLTCFEAKNKTNNANIGVISGNIDFPKQPTPESGHIYFNNFGFGSYNYLQLSTELVTSNPVIVQYPAIGSNPAKKAVYFLSSTGASTIQNKIIEYNLINNMKTALTVPLYYLKKYTNLSGGVNPGSGAFVITAGFDKTDFYNPQSDRRDIAIYTKSNGAASQIPALVSTYTDLYSPTVMVDQAATSGAPVYQIYANPGSGYWNKIDGTSQISYLVSTNVLFPYLSERIPSGNRTAMINRMAYSPSLPKIQKYSGSGILQKSDGESKQVAWMTAHRFITDRSGIEHEAVLDFTGGWVESLKEMETGKVISAVKIVKFNSDGILVSQPDSLVIPLSIDLERDGNVIKSFESSEWSELHNVSITGLKEGDLVIFKMTENYISSHGYDSYSVDPSGLSKRQAGDQSEISMLKDLKLSISSYPNPFNPATTFRITLPVQQWVILEVYNILGQKVQTLANGKLNAGEHDFRFDGTKLSSGTYIYRMQVAEKVKSGKILLLK